MTDFLFSFLISNIYISFMVGIIFLVKKLFGSFLSARSQYSLWHILLGLLFLPFLPVPDMKIPSFLKWFHSLITTPFMSDGNSKTAKERFVSTGTADWINDFSISVDKNTSDIITYLFLAIWILGICFIIFGMAKSYFRLSHLKQAALPLQNQAIYKTYAACKKKLRIKKSIPLFSTTHIKSPMITGLFRPAIYVPDHLLSFGNEKEIRHMLLHELWHYKHRDIFINMLINTACMIYWFNPCIWFARKELRSDQELACDASVLSGLSAQEHLDYGNTLIDFAEAITVSSFASGLSGTMKQMQRRILNITSYKKPSLKQKCKSVLIFGMTAILLFSLVPNLLIHANKDNHSKNNITETVTQLDLASYFKEDHGCFVLYDSSTESWHVYNESMSTLRSSPTSTYKIYSALLALESGVITPDKTSLSWNGDDYPFNAWKSDHDLKSAMKNSVNWYFQTLDAQTGYFQINEFLQKLEYGNTKTGTNLDTYWMDDSLKISPLEQVELLQKLYINDFEFKKENVETVKQSLFLESTASSSLYGKTGTGQTDGQNTLGWFIGYIEKGDKVYYFATNIKDSPDASGSSAAQITLSILSDLAIWN